MSLEEDKKVFKKLENLVHKSVEEDSLGLILVWTEKENLGWASLNHLNYDFQM